MCSKRALYLATAGLAAMLAGRAAATDIYAVQSAALDMPMIYAGLSRTPDGPPLVFQTYGIDDEGNLIIVDSPAIGAYFDTGASGILIGKGQAGEMGVLKSTYNSQPVVFRDIGVGGFEEFDVSEPLYVCLAPYHSSTDIYTTASFHTTFNQQFGAMRLQISRQDPDPFLGEELNVFGISVMQGKVVVIDPKPANPSNGENTDTMRTYVYNPNTPRRPSTPDSDPGIPMTSRHVKLSYADFARFTQTLPAGAEGPALASNPFVGPNPLIALAPGAAPDNTPGISVSYNGKTSTSSWLLDTGGQVTMISTIEAAKLGISYDPATIDTENPVLLGVPESEQFVLPIGGVGGQVYIAGFYVDTLLVPTQEGDASSEHANHLRYVRAPVFVRDITMADPLTGQDYTIAGVLGMNLFMPSVTLDLTTWPPLGEMQDSNFDWFVFDQPGGTLGLQLAGSSERSIQWTGAAGGATWSTAAQSWSDGVGPSAFVDGDHVRFTDDAVDGIVNIVGSVAPGSMVFDHSLKDFALRGDSIIGGGGLTKYGSGTLTMENSNQYTGSTEIRAGKIIMKARQNIGPVRVFAGTELEMQSSQKFKELRVEDGLATLAKGKDKLLELEDLTILGTGKLDLADNAMVIRATADNHEQMLDRITGYIRSARGNKTWLGDGLTCIGASPDTYHGLAILLNDSNGNAIYPEYDTNTILVKYTLNGDMDLNGVVNTLDYARIDQGFLSGGALKGYQYGDLDYNGVINTLDYALIDGAFLAQGGLHGQAERTILSSPAVPEPGGVAAVGAAMLLMLRRRRRV